MNDKQFEKTKIFHCKQGFSINKDLTEYKKNVNMSLFLKDIGNMCINNATAMEAMMKVDHDPRLARVQLMVEELGETILGLAHCDELETLDGLADLEFVTKGAAIAFGLPLPAAVDEICKSNLTKAKRSKDDIRLRDKGESYVPPNLKRILALHRGVKVTAVRTNCMTGIVKDIEVLVMKSFYAGSLNEWQISITSGAVTGYESMLVKNVYKVANDNTGWHACAGTKGRWDTLFLPATSMMKIAEWLKETE